MKVNRVSGLILATDTQIVSHAMEPLQALKRIIVGYQQIGVFPIVIIIDETLTDLKYQLSKYGVIFLINEEKQGTEKIKLIKQGIAFIKNFSDTVIYTALNVPLFYVDTLQRLLSYEKVIVVPSFQNKGGHPVVIRHELFDDLLHYEGPNGLQGFFQLHSDKRQHVEVNDQGTSSNMRQLNQFNELVPIYTHVLLHPQVKIQLALDEVLFDQQGKILFFLIDEIGSVSQAAKWMGISYSKAWKIIDTLELEMGEEFIIRRQGGIRKKRASLTEAAKKLLINYLALEETILEITKNQFDLLFK